MTLTLQRGISVFESLRVTHVLTLSSNPICEEGDVTRELLLLVLRGGVEEERSEVITTTLGNPPPLQCWKPTAF